MVGTIRGFIRGIVCSNTPVSFNVRHVCGSFKFWPLARKIGVEVRVKVVRLGVRPIG